MKLYQCTFDRYNFDLAIVIAKKLKYKYVGYTIQDQDLKWNKILTTWIPQIKCPKRLRSGFDDNDSIEDNL